jgi:hypothetical protein
MELTKILKDFVEQEMSGKNGARQGEKLLQEKMLVKKNKKERRIETVIELETLERLSSDSRNQS